MTKEQIRNIERGIYLAVIIGLVIYGCKDTEAATKLIDLFTRAVSIVAPGV